MSEEKDDIVKELEELDRNCHEAIKREDLSHLPMCFVRYKPPESLKILIEKLGKGKEATVEIVRTFYICRQCISDWIVRTKGQYMDRVAILRGEITEEAKKTYYDWLRNRKQATDKR